jgi:hypothetical protein
MSGMAVGKKAMLANRARTLALCCLAASVAALIGVLGATKPAHARTFTVTNTNASGAGSLEQAIANANANNNTPTIDAIKFNIPTSDPGFGLTTPGVFTISSTSALSQITEPLSIDGYSQGKGTTNTTADDAKPNTLAVGNNAVLKIELRRTVTGAGTGLWIGAKNTTVKGLVINRWEEGVRISGSGSRANKVQGNFLGTDASGAQDPGGSLFGVIIDGAPANTVGGTTAGARNLISANDQSGVSISGAGATANKVMGNYVGTKANGTEALKNSSNGVFVHDGAANNTVGGTTPAARNVISGNGTRGLYIKTGATGNKIMGNYVGTDASGTQRLASDQSGVFIEDAPNNTIGGTASGARNVISGNGDYGVGISNSDARANRVQGNYIGTNASGTQDLANFNDGVFIEDAPANTIGGTTAGARNVISGNAGNGVRIQNSGATGNKVLGNFIGTDASGTLDRGNGGNGVFVHDGAANNTVGGTTVGARNVIFGNEGYGVGIRGDNATTGNSIFSNSIDDNDQLGINLVLNFDDVTANDTGDGDTGSNNLQNFPELSSAQKTGDKTTIKGTLNSSAETTFTIQFFSSLEKDPSGHGEGKKFLGQKSVPTDGSGNASFTTTAPVIPAGQVVSATATNQSTGDTSEFSVAIFAS